MDLQSLSYGVISNSDRTSHPRSRTTTVRRSRQRGAVGIRARLSAKENAMLNFQSKTFDDLAARIGKAVEASPAKDIEKNVKAMLQSGLARLDVVTRDEFDTQAAVLAKTREKLEQLELRVAELEARASPR
jgi:ubiquinone biosynthesis accessory factor UbiK